MLITLVVVGGCNSLAPPSESAGSGINLRYIFGDRRTVSEIPQSLVNDPEYSEYLEWKRWQDFQAYQEWKELREQEREPADLNSN